MTVEGITSAGAASPGAIWNILWTSQWYDLQVRCKSSVHDNVYRSVKIEPKWIAAPVPQPVQCELLSLVLLGLFWSVDITVPYLPMFLHIGCIYLVWFRRRYCTRSST